MGALIEIGNLYSRLTGDIPSPVYEQIAAELSYKFKDARFRIEAINRKREREAMRLGTRFVPTAWDGSVKLYHKNQNMFYTGMMTPLMRLLAANNIPVQTLDRREKPAVNDPDMRLVLPEGKTERGYQNTTVDVCYNAGRGIIQCATGGGKTLMVTKLIDRIKTVPFIFFTLTEDLMAQAYETLSICLNRPIGRIGGGMCDIQGVNVCMIQTAIRSLNRNNTAFKLDNYRYDDEEEWGKEDSVAQKNGAAIEALIRSAKGVYVDECVTGDSEVVTEKGKMPISQVLSSGSRFVMTHDGSKPVFRPILNFWRKGVQDTIKIKLDDGRFLKCTKNHVVLTETGWKQAENLKIGEKFLCADAVAGHNFQSTSPAHENTYLGTRLEGLTLISGGRNIKAFSRHSRFAPVAVARRFCQVIKHSTSLSKPKEAEGSIDTCVGTTNSQFGLFTTSLQPLKKNRQFWGRALETLVCRSLTEDRKTINLLPTTGGVKSSGHDTKLDFSNVSVLQLKSEKTRDSENTGREWTPNACQPCLKYQSFCTPDVKKSLQKNFLTRSETLALRGGSATTDPTAKGTGPLLSTLKAGLSQKMNLSPDGLMSEGTTAQWVTTNQKICTSSDLTSKALLDSLPQSDPTSRLACSTSWHTITSIEPDEPQEVFDLEVEGSHCFFANGVLVHNCHHAAADTVREVLMAAKNAYWRFGGSATPFREDGQEKMLQALFGRKLVNISASWLIQRGWLVRPYILNVRFEDGAAGDWKSYQKVYKESIVDNAQLHDFTARVIQHFVSHKITTLGLVKEYPHGEALQSRLPGVPFLRGDNATVLRRGTIAGLRDGTIPVAIGTTLADEGLDVPRLGAVVVAGGGKSINRVFQRVGRPIRTFPGKKCGFVVLIHHDGHFLDDHGRGVRHILKSEKEFVIRNCTVHNAIDEITKIMDEQGQESLLSD